MTHTNSTQEEVTVIEHQAPQQVVRKTVTQVEPPVKGEAPQQVFEKKKTIFRSSQIIWYVLGLIEALLAFRLILKMLGANSTVGFTSLIYALTEPFAAPFYGVVGASTTATSMLEWSTIIAGVVYFCVAWGIISLLDLIYPITPKDVEPLT